MWKVSVHGNTLNIHMYDCIFSHVEHKMLLLTRTLMCIMGFLGFTIAFLFRNDLSYSLTELVPQERTHWGVIRRMTWLDWGEQYLIFGSFHRIYVAPHLPGASTNNSIMSCAINRRLRYNNNWCNYWRYLLAIDSTNIWFVQYFWFDNSSCVIGASEVGFCCLQYMGCRIDSAQRTYDCRICISFITVSDWGRRRRFHVSPNANFSMSVSSSFDLLGGFPTWWILRLIDSRQCLDFGHALRMSTINRAPAPIIETIWR